MGERETQPETDLVFVFVWRQAPGSAYHNDEPGWFRVTFSVKRANLVVGLAKMEEILGLEVVAA